MLALNESYDEVYSLWSVKTLPLGLTNCVTLSEWKILTSCMPGMVFMPIFFKTDCNRLSSLLTDLCIAFFFLRKQREPGSMSSFYSLYLLIDPFPPIRTAPANRCNLSASIFVYSSSVRQLRATCSGPRLPTQQLGAFLPVWFPCRERLSLLSFVIYEGKSTEMWNNLLFRLLISSWHNIQVKFTNMTATRWPKPPYGSYMNDP